MLTLSKIEYSTNSNKLFTNLNFSLVPGAIFYILGSNGSGKSTLLKIIADIITPENGQISYKNFKIQDLQKPYCCLIGHKNAMDENLTVRENLEFWSGFYKSTELVDAALYHFDILDLADEKLINLSAGQQQKASLSKLLCCYSEIWLLDEADINLDINAQEKLVSAIKTHSAQGGITILTSHKTTQDLNKLHYVNLDDYK